MVHLRWIASLVLLSLLCPLVTPAAWSQPKLVIWSWDGAAADEVAYLQAKGRMSHLASVAKEGAHAVLVPTEYSFTAPGHATLWTGADPNVHGVTMNRNPMTGASGFLSTALKAEPLWVTAAKKGLRVACVQATHVEPFAPYGAGGRFGLNRAQAKNLFLFNGFEGLRSPANALTIHPGKRRQRVDIGGRTFLLNVNRRQISIQSGPEGSPQMLGNVSDGKHFTTLRSPGRPPNIFSAGILWNPPGAILVHSPLGMVRTNQPKKLKDYYKKAGPFWTGHIRDLYKEGKLFEPRLNGGDGRAEEALLTLARASIYQSVRTIKFGLKDLKADVVFAYVPYPDSISHMFDLYFRNWMVGRGKIREKYLAETQAKLYEILDDALAEVIDFADKHGAAVAVVSDHGMAGMASPSDPLSTGGHRTGLPSSLQALFYMSGPGVKHINLGSMPQRDVAPTLALYLGIPSPAQATGRAHSISK